MKLKITLLAVALVAAVAGRVQGASVAASGGYTNSFATAPVAADWAGGSIAGGAGGAADSTTSAMVDTNIAALAHTAVAATLNVSNANPANVTGPAVYLSAGLLQLRSTGVRISLLKGTFVNDALTNATGVRISFDYATNLIVTEQVPGLRVYYSLTNGQPGSWVNIPALSEQAAGVLTANLDFSASPWNAGSTMYLLFADDNGSGTPDMVNHIDNFSLTITAGTIGTVPLSLTLTAPANGLTVFETTNLTVTATNAGSFPPTSVEFYTNGVLAATDLAAPYTAVIPGLVAGSYTVYARGINGVDPDAYSATNTVTVRPVLSYTGGTLTQDFDGMGETGTTTPTGWYVSAAPPVNGVTVTAGAGTSNPLGAVLGWNYGVLGVNPASDRALGTAPTGAERNIAVALRNNTGSNMTSMEIHFDGEVWRNYTNPVVTGVLSNYVSIDGGVTWVPTGLFFAQPFPPAQPVGAADGNEPTNRTADINGIITLPAPVADGQVIFIRWWDANEGGTDGGLAIDNFSFRGGFAAFVNSAVIVLPTNGATFAEGANVTVTATANMANPVTNVVFYQNGIPFGADTTAPFSAVYSNASVGAHTLTAIAADSTGATVTTSNTVVININPNVPPTVTMTNPIGGTFLVGVTVTNVSASATDSDGTIARVEFFVNNAAYGFDTTSPYRIDLCDINLGSNLVSAVAVDNVGARVTNSIFLVATNPPGVSMVVSNGAAWRYLDDGTDQGSAWRLLAFDDAGWSNGVAEFGYGDAPGRPERTTVGFGTNVNGKFATTYFRKKFEVASPGAFPSYLLRVLKDDRCLVYINDVLVYSDITNAVVNYDTYPPGAIAHDGTVYVETNVPPGVLVAGTNIVAVEVHQEGPDSTDISFDLMLWGVSGGGPRLTIVQTGPTSAEVSWGADAVGYFLQVNTGDVGTAGDWSDVGGVITGAGSFPVSFPPPDRKFFQLRKP